MGNNSAKYLPSTAEYALRVMSFIALVPESKRLKAGDLSAATSIPQHYLSKVLRKLVVAGLLKGQKGHGGGFVLARDAEEIRFMDILSAVDYRPEPDHCAFGWGGCNTREPCPLHHAWSRLNQNFIRWAHDTTLASVRQGGHIRSATALGIAGRAAM